MDLIAPTDAPLTLRYDGSYAGLLSAVFEVFRLKLVNAELVTELNYRPGLFAEALLVTTDPTHAGRVHTGIGRYGGKPAQDLARRCFLSEAEDRERILLRYIKRLVAREVKPEEDLLDPLMLRLSQLNKQMGREIHRMHAFVRFQVTPDDMYAALIEPDFDVLPLLESHFVERYPAQDWLIYDTRRRYGLLWDQTRERSEFITLTEGSTPLGTHLSPEQLGTVEPKYQQLWKAYFQAVDIPERRNMKLHIQHVPRRYWKYLVEKW
jgi:probable DNA metabolism protein